MYDQSLFCFGVFILYSDIYIIYITINVFPDLKFTRVQKLLSEGFCNLLFTTFVFIQFSHFIYIDFQLIISFLNREMI